MHGLEVQVLRDNFVVKKRLADQRVELFAGEPDGEAEVTGIRVVDRSSLICSASKHKRCA